MMDYKKQIQYLQERVDVLEGYVFNLISTDEHCECEGQIRLTMNFRRYVYANLGEERLEQKHKCIECGKVTWEEVDVVPAKAEGDET